MYHRPANQYACMEPPEQEPDKEKLPNMKKIAVCDDDIITLEHLSERIRQEAPFECEVYSFQSSSGLLEQCRKTLFDALFLDIDMPELDGMKLAEAIRENDQYVRIIFVTNKEECVFSAYRYSVFRFLRKSRLNAELGEALAALDSVFSAADDSMVFRKSVREQDAFSDKDVNIPIRSITYFEAAGHSLILHRENSEMKIMGTLNEIEKKLSAKGFIRIHKAFLVNYRSIFSIGKTDIRLTDGKELPVSRNRLNDVKLQFQLASRSDGI